MVWSVAISLVFVIKELLRHVSREICCNPLELYNNYLVYYSLIIKPGACRPHVRGFLKLNIDTVWIVGMRVHVCPRPRLLITSGVNEPHTIG